MKNKIIFIGSLTFILILLYIIYNFNYYNNNDLNYSFGGGDGVEQSTQINPSLGEE